MNDGISVIGRDVVGLRRLFHAHAETAFTELWTSVTIAAELRRLGYRVLTGPDAIDLSGVPALPGPQELARAADRARAHAPEEGRNALLAAAQAALGLHALPRAAAAAHEVEVRIERIGAATTAVHADHRFGASDDATFLMRAVQERGGKATFLVVGASSPAPHHSPAFDIDEACLGIAADTMERAIRLPEKERQ